MVVLDGPETSGDGKLITAVLQDTSAPPFGVQPLEDPAADRAP